MLTQTDVELLNSIRQQTRTALADVIGAHRDVAIIDAPNQRNVGDSLIWAGEIAYLRQLGVRIRYVADINTFSAENLRAAMPEGVVLLHGGGNFGDIWPGHQEHREHVVRALRDFRIVQLSQSVYFSSDERAALANDRLAEHPDLIVLLRDALSIERATRQLPSLRVRFCHDMALGWDAPGGAGRPNAVQKVLAIARADHEASSGLASIDAAWLPDVTVESVDWSSTGRRLARWSRARKFARVHRRLSRLTARGPHWLARVTNWHLARVIAQINDINIDGAVDLYLRADLIVVDRLHAHVLAALMGIRHVVLDNNYRKVSAIYHGYTGRFSTAEYATDLDHARDILRASLSGTSAP